jgi:O-antigen/teichoic acid export membrane protein
LGENKRIAVNSIILFVRLVVTTIVGLISSRIVLQALGASDYGLYAIVGGIVIMLNFLSTVMTSTTYRFIAFEMGKKDGNVAKVFNTSLVIHIFLAILVVIFAEFPGMWYVRNHLRIEKGMLPAAIFVFRISILTVIFSVIIVPFQGLITALEKFLVRAVIEITRALLKLGLVLILIYYTGDKLRLYAIIMLIVTVVPALMFLLYCYRNYYTEVKWKLQRDLNKYFEILKYSFWIVFGALARIGKTQGSAIIINFFFGTVLNASFGLASQLNTYVQTFAQNLGQVAIPQITKNYSGGNKKRSYDLVCHISKYTFFLMLLVAVPLLIKMDYALKLWLGEVPEYTVELSRLIIANSMLESLGYGLFSIIAAHGKIMWFQIITSLLSLTGLPIAILFYKWGYLPYSISVIYAFITAVLIVTQLIILKNVTKVKISKMINISYKHVFWVCILITPIYFIGSKFNDSFLGFTGFVIVSIVWVILSAFLVGLNHKEKEYLFEVIGKLYRKYINRGN